MAMGASYNYSKGNGNGNGNGSSSSSSSSSSSRGRSYGMKLVMAFGAALLGVIVLHKLRERRIFNLILKEKDTDLISLHLLLQKETDYTKELKRKNEEMKTKLYTIRTQKMELDRRVLELKSTVGSLKEELQTMEGALEDKQSEIKMLRMNTENENPQVMELQERLKRKEAEIEDLKHRLENPVKVWSVSTDDPSNPAVNLTWPGSVAGKEVTDQLQESTSNKDTEKTRPGEDGSGNKSISFRQGETTTEVGDQIGNGEGETDRREMIDKQSEKLDNSKDGNIKQGSTEEEGQGKEGEESNLENAAEAIISDPNRKDVERKVIESDEIKSTGNSEVGEGQKLHVTPKGGMKLDMQDNSNGSKRSRVRGKQGNISGDRRKKWRLIAEHRRLENRENFKNNGVGSMGSVRSRRFFKDDQNWFMGREEEAASNRRLTGENPNTVAGRPALDSSDAKNLELRNPENTDRGIPNNDTKQKLEVRKSEDHDAINIQQQNLNNVDIEKPETSAEQLESVHTRDLPEDLEVADAEEQERDVADDNLFDESSSNLEEDKEEYKEEIDEPKF